jgi:hypothetical protein
MANFRAKNNTKADTMLTQRMWAVACTLDDTQTVNNTRKTTKIWPASSPRLKLKSPQINC